ncbi:MAG: Rpn family recombination-promoting nuclease/putative transposase [Treponema sp.]|nr:Rpn family recombination-promoting nuclease/putative transposase [Treponema sp.]
MPEKTYIHKPIEELTFTDDGMFQAVLHEPNICAELVERLLHIRVSHVEYPEIEKQIAPYFTTKGVRLDVYLKDSDKIIDVEMQSYPQEALGKRTRYYSSMIDMDSLMKGQDYTELKDCYILFICKKDPFNDDNDRGYGLPCYTFSNKCHEDTGVNLNDKTIKVIYNASAYREEKDQRIRDFLHFVYTNECGEDDFSNRLSAIVEKLKENEKFRSDYLAMNLHDRDLIRRTRKEAIEEGFSQGAREMAIENARSFLREGDSPEKVARCIGLALEQVQQIKEELSASLQAK